MTCFEVFCDDLFRSDSVMSRYFVFLRRPAMAKFCNILIVSVL